MDTQSFISLYDAFFRRSTIFVKSYVHDDLVAEDIAAEALMKLWELIQKDPGTNIAPLLFTILKNKALDHLKHIKVIMDTQQKISKLLQRELDLRLTTLEATNPEEIFSTEVKFIIHKTINSLPEKTRQIFLMSRYEGIPYKKIAEEFQITVKGVDYHISSANNSLRIALKDYLPIWICLIHQFK